LRDAVNQTKAKAVREAFAAVRGGTYAAAAKYLSINENHLHRLVGNLKLREEIQRMQGREAS
jgi:hypothetical protein